MSNKRQREQIIKNAKLFFKFHRSKLSFHVELAQLILRISHRRCRYHVARDRARQKGNERSLMQILEVFLRFSHIVCEPITAAFACCEFVGAHSFTSLCVVLCL